MTNFLSKWREVLIWIPVAVGILLLAYWLFPKMDPRAGIDGFGDLFLFLVQVVKVLVALFITWVAKRAYWRDLNSRMEKALDESYLTGNRAAFHITLRDRAEFVALFLAISWVLF